MSCDACNVPVWIDPAFPGRFLRHHATYPLRLEHRRENLSDIKLANNMARID